MNDEMRKAVQEVFEELNNMTKEEFLSHINGNFDPDPCHPDTCAGQCQGFGGCYVCDEFHNTFQTMKKEFKVDQKVRIVNAMELSGLSGTVLGKSFVEVLDHYIVLLDTPLPNAKAVSITEACLETL